MIDVTPTLEALREGHVTRYAALLAIAEMDFARRGESPDIYDLAAHFHCSVESLYRWRRELRQAGLLPVKQQGMAIDK